MVDAWPNERDDLSIPDHHPIWSFRRHRGEAPTVTFRVEEDEKVQQVDIHLKYGPPLACFDLEYWKEISNGSPTEIKQHQLRKYLHQLRRDIAEEIFGDDSERVKLGTKEILALHPWSQRTWFNFRHTPFGRQNYLERCRQKDLKPYGAHLRADGE
jgi:hypothetical protein